MMRLILFCLLFPVLGAWAGEHQVAVLDDPAGDDNGNGTLVYPQRQDIQPGDLDLVSLRIVHHDAAYRFEASFRNPIRNPASVAGDVGPESLAYFARRGFYAFNLDIYIDQDRVQDSGNTYTLPGRHVAIDTSHAWEKAVILTPRPELMRQQLIDAVAESEGARDSDEAAKRLDASIFFPTKIRVRNRTVSFDVPDVFLAGERPDTDWSITAFVTGAKTSIEANFDLTSSPGATLEQLPLGVLQPKPGRPRDSFGYSGISAPGPVVDLLAPAPLKQQALLSGTTALVGITWSASGAVVTAAESGRPVTSITSTVTPQPAAPASIGMQSGNQRGIKSGIKSGDIAERLRQLNELRAQKLINDQEYEELRRKILADL
jgi:hypothetical protein